MSRLTNLYSALAIGTSALALTPQANAEEYGRVHTCQNDERGAVVVNKPDKNKANFRGTDELALYQKGQKQPLLISKQPLNIEAAKAAADAFCNNGTLFSHQNVSKPELDNAAYEFYVCKNDSEDRRAAYVKTRKNYKYVEDVQMVSGNKDDWQSIFHYASEVKKDGTSHVNQEKATDAVKHYCETGEAPKYTTELTQ